MIGIEANFGLALSQLSAFQEKLPRIVKTVQGKISLDVFAGVIKRSPVDTGRFRGNWMISIGAPSEGWSEDKATRKPRRASDPPRKPGGIKGSERAEASQVGFSLMKMELGQEVWIVNNVPYGWALEEGHSPQAPKGVMLVTVLSVVERAKRALNIEISL